MCEQWVIFFFNDGDVVQLSMSIVFITLPDDDFDPPSPTHTRNNEEDGGTSAEGLSEAWLYGDKNHAPKIQKL
jgi:hypothetical protein